MVTNSTNASQHTTGVNAQTTSQAHEIDPPTVDAVARRPSSSPTPSSFPTPSVPSDPILTYTEASTMMSGINATDNEVATLDHPEDYYCPTTLTSEELQSVQNLVKDKCSILCRHNMTRDCSEDVNVPECIKNWKNVTDVKEHCKSARLVLIHHAVRAE